MHNLKIVIWFEFVRTIKKKSFWLSVLAFPAIVGLVAGVAYFSGKAANQAQQKLSQERFRLVTLDASGLVADSVLSQIGGRRVATKQVGIATVTSGKAEAFIYYPADVTKQPVEIFAQDVGLVKNSKYSSTALLLLELSERTKISPQQQAIIRGEVKTEMTTYIDGKVAPGFERVVAPGAILALFYVTFVLMAGRMLASTTEEKENRVIEMLLANIQARTLVIGKILSLLLIGVVQVVAVGIPVALIGYLARDYIHLPSIDLSKVVFDPGVLMVSLLIFACAYLLFTGILVAIGSAVPTAKEAGSFMGVAMFAMFVPLYAFQAIISDPSQLIVRVFSWFPLSSPITLLLRNAVGNLTVGEAIGSISLLAVSAGLALVVATRTFGYGTMEYSRKLNWREILGAR